MINAEVKKFVVGPVQTNCYVVRCTNTGSVLVIDPGSDNSALLNDLDRLDTIVFTHGHFDHVGGASVLIDRFSPETMIHSKDAKMMSSAALHAAEWGFEIKQPPPVARLLSNGENLTLGELTFSVIHAPGHSRGSICLLGHGLLFSGDTLFAGSIGRTDLPQSSSVMMKRTLQHLTTHLDGNLILHPGHGPSSTMAEEKIHNPFLRNL